MMPYLLYTKLFIPPPPPPQKKKKKKRFSVGKLISEHSSFGQVTLRIHLPGYPLPHPLQSL